MVFWVCLSTTLTAACFLTWDKVTAIQAIQLLHPAFWQLWIQQNLLISFMSSVSLPHHTVIMYIPVFGVPAAVGKVGTWHSFSGIFTVSRQWPAFVVYSKFCYGSGVINVVPSLMMASLIIPLREFQFSTLWYA